MAATAPTIGRNQTHSDSSPPRPFTADDIILLAQQISATLPPSFSSSALIPLLHSPPPSLLSSLLSLLSRSPPSPSPSLLTPVLLSFLHHFFTRNLPRDPDCFHLIFPLLSHLEHSHLSSILEVLSSYLSDIADAEDALALDLLPHLLKNLAAQCGDLISPFLDKLLSGSWSKAVLVKMCSLIRDCPAISRVRVSEFVRKIFDGMRDVDIQDLPWLVFQLLLLASKGISSVSRKELIGLLLRFFGEPMKGSDFVVRQVEGTVLMHVNFSIKQDPSLGSDFIAVVRGDVGTINHFTAAVLLSVARIRRFNEGSIGALKSVVVGSYQDCKFAR